MKVNDMDKEETTSDILKRMDKELIDKISNSADELIVRLLLSEQEKCKHEWGNFSLHLTTCQKCGKVEPINEATSES